MKHLLKMTVLAASLSAGMGAAAFAAPDASVQQADYIHHGHHYAYHHNGGYYNHREKRDGVWHYY